MPLINRVRINEHTQLAIWKIEEPIDFFTLKVPVYRDITHPKKRLEHYAGRYLLYVLDNHFPFEKIVYHSDSTAPYIADNPVFFSISHSKNYVAAILGKDKVGIDIETNFERPFLLKERFFHPLETEWIKGFETAAATKICQYIWCIKEAVYKSYAPLFLEFKKDIIVDKFCAEKNVTTAISVKIDMPNLLFSEEKKGQLYTAEEYSCAYIW